MGRYLLLLWTDAYIPGKRGVPSIDIATFAKKVKY
jgi:hypothetical protein